MSTANDTVTPSSDFVDLGTARLVTVEESRRRRCYFNRGPRRIAFNRPCNHALLSALVTALLLVVSVPARASIVNAASVAAADVAIAVAAAKDGDTVVIPAGTATWSGSGVGVSGKAIKIVGAGSGGLVGHSESSVAIGTGSKTFTITNVPSGVSLSTGQAIRAIYPPDGTNYMDGTVTSYSGTTLVLNVTSVGGSGTKAFWVFATPATTTIINSSNSDLFAVNESTNGNVDISGIYFLASGNTVSGNHINIFGTSGGQPVLIHNCRLSVSTAGARGILTNVNRGVVHHCSFDARFEAKIASSGFSNEVICDKNPADTFGSWTANSTMGSNDATGTSNFYIEDSYFAGTPIYTMDFDDGTRVVVRHNVFDNSGLSSHGADTSFFGQRHIEIYDNTFLFTIVGNDTFNVVDWLYLRGGTGVITDNTMPVLSSVPWGHKASIRMTVQNLQRNSGNWPCWSTYPAPHQIGQGYGSGAVFHAGPPSYYTYTEPLYLWNNTGEGNSPGVEDYGCGSANVCPNCSSQPLGSSFVQSGRDYITNTAKPGYAKFTYPHPLANTGSKPAAPSNLHVQ